MHKLTHCIYILHNIIWLDLQFLLCLKSYTHSFAHYQSTNASGFCTHFEQEGCLQDVGGHIIYSPLRCHIPLPGLESLRFCSLLVAARESINILRMDLERSLPISRFVQKPPLFPIAHAMYHASSRLHPHYLVIASLTRFLVTRGD